MPSALSDLVFKHRFNAFKRIRKDSRPRHHNKTWFIVNYFNAHFRIDLMLILPLTFFVIYIKNCFTSKSARKNPTIVISFLFYISFNLPLTLHGSKPNFRRLIRKILRTAINLSHTPILRILKIIINITSQFPARYFVLWQLYAKRVIGIYNIIRHIKWR